MGNLSTRIASRWLNSMRRNVGAVSGPDKCTNCRGSGFDSRTLDDCTTCGGTGRKPGSVEAAPRSARPQFPTMDEPEPGMRRIMFVEWWWRANQVFGKKGPNGALRFVDDDGTGVTPVVHEIYLEDLFPDVNIPEDYVGDNRSPAAASMMDWIRDLALEQNATVADNIIGDGDPNDWRQSVGNDDWNDSVD